MDNLDEACRLIKQAQREFEESKDARYIQLEKRIARLESENRALRQSVAMLQEKRRQDRDRVRQWEVAFSQTESKQLNSDLPTQLASDLQSSQVGLQSQAKGQDELARDELEPKEPKPNEREPKKLSKELYPNELNEQINEPDSLPADLPSQPLPSSQPLISASLPLDSDDLASDLGPELTLDEIPSSEPDLKSLLAREWHPSDFIVNTKYSKAYTEVVRGAKRQCLHGKDCNDCSKFYAILGDGGAAAIQKASRHREDWARQNTPPGFWRSDFVDTQQHQKEKGDMAAKRAAEASERFQEALVNGKYLFRDRALREIVNRINK